MSQHPKTGGVQLPGKPVSATELNLDRQAIRDQRIRPSPDFRVEQTPSGQRLRLRSQSSASRSTGRKTIGPLTLTGVPHPAYEFPDPDTFTGDRTWVYPGFLDFAMPSNIHEPILFPDAGSTQSIAVWLKATWEGEFLRAGTPLWTGITIEKSAVTAGGSAPYGVGPAMNTEEVPGVAGPGFYDFYIIPIGQISRFVTGSGATQSKTLQRSSVATGSLVTRVSTFLSQITMGASATEPPRADIYYTFEFRRNT